MWRESGGRVCWIAKYREDSRLLPNKTIPSAFGSTPQQQSAAAPLLRLTILYLDYNVFKKRTGSHRGEEDDIVGSQEYIQCGEFEEENMTKWWDGKTRETSSCHIFCQQNILMTSLTINFQERRDVSYEGGTLYVSSYIRPRRMIRILYDSHMTMTISRSRSRTVQDSILRFFFKKRDIWFNLAIYGSHMTIICEDCWKMPGSHLGCLHLWGPPTKFPDVRVPKRDAGCFAWRWLPSRYRWLWLLLPIQWERSMISQMDPQLQSSSWRETSTIAGWPTNRATQSFRMLRVGGSMPSRKMGCFSHLVYMLGMAILRN